MIDPKLRAIYYTLLLDSYQYDTNTDREACLASLNAWGNVSEEAKVYIRKKVDEYEVSLRKEVISGVLVKMMEPK